MFDGTASEKSSKEPGDDIEQLPVDKIALVLPGFVMLAGTVLVALGFAYRETFESGYIAGFCLLFFGIIGFLHLASVILEQGTWLNETDDDS